MSENAIQPGQSIADAPQAPGSVGASESTSDDLQTQTLAGQPPAENDNAEGETTEEAVERMIHGMNADEVLAALEEGVIPEALYEHLSFKARIDGQDEEIPLHEHRLERMRLSDYSRRMQALKNERDDFTRSRDAFSGMVDAWRNKDPMQVTRTLEELEHLGLPIHELTTIYAQRHYEQQQLVEAVPEHLRPMYKAMMADREEMRRSLAQLKLQGTGQPQRGQRDDGAAAATRERIQRMAPSAFKKEKLVDTKANQEAFYQHLGAIWDRSSELTQQHINDAARAVREDLERNLKALGFAPAGAANDNGQAQPKPRAVAPAHGAQPSVRRAAAQAPRNPGGGANGASAMTLDQLRAKWGPR